MKNLLYSYFIIIPLLALTNLYVYGCANSAQASNPQFADDSHIILEIENKIKAEPILKDVNVVILAKNGNVKISGIVNTMAQAEKIIAFAQSNKYVNEVDATSLTIKNSSSPLIDTYITAKVKGILMKEDILNSITNIKNVHVETKNKIVYLTGYLSNQKQIDEVIDAVKALNDVIAVRNNIKIKK